MHSDRETETETHRDWPYRVLDCGEIREVGDAVPVYGASDECDMHRVENPGDERSREGVRGAK